MRAADLFLSGNLCRRLCFRIMAMSCHDSSTHVRWCPPLSVSIVTQLVSRTLKHLMGSASFWHAASMTSRIMIELK